MWSLQPCQYSCLHNYITWHNLQNNIHKGWLTPRWSGKCVFTPKEKRKKTESRTNLCVPSKVKDINQTNCAKLQAKLVFHKKVSTPDQIRIMFKKLIKFLSFNQFRYSINYRVQADRNGRHRVVKKVRESNTIQIKAWQRTFMVTFQKEFLRYTKNKRNFLTISNFFAFKCENWNVKFVCKEYLLIFVYVI